jgi:hypothetical protein
MLLTLHMCVADWASAVGADFAAAGQGNVEETLQPAADACFPQKDMCGTHCAPAVVLLLVSLQAGQR